jgi:F-type H+-transporting ATPase subunit gamma
MPSLKEVRSSIVSVNSTQQITKAMKMVSASKLRRAQDAITRIRPFTEKLEGILSNLSDSLEEGADNAFGQVRPVQRVLLVVVTSDRGLAGAFNNNIIKATLNLIEEKYARLGKENIELLCFGKKGTDFFLKREYKVHSGYSDIFKRMSFEAFRPAAEMAMNGFLNKEYDEVVVLYNHFKNVATQVLVTQPFLPIPPKEVKKGQAAGPLVDYILEPSQKEIVEELIPKSLKISFYSYLLDSNASEHGARMTAMDKATDNAKEMLKALRLQYNRGRQAAITKEILEIVGGAEALNG